MSNYSDLFLQEFNEKKSTNSFKEPPKLTFFNGCFDKTQVKLLVSWFLNEYGEKKTVDFCFIWVNTERTLSTVQIGSGVNTVVLNAVKKTTIQK